MRIAITGASGFIGSRLSAALAAEGHDLAPIGRGRFEEIAGAEALIHLAGETLAQRWTSKAKERVRSSRVEGTRRLVEAMSAFERPPAVFLCASAVGYYGSRGDEILTEESSAGGDFLASLCVDWEREAGAAARLGIRVVRMRFGMVLGRGGGALSKMLTPFRLGVGGVLGSGRQWMSWIHMQDLVALVSFALASSRLAGPVNATSPNPVTNAIFTAELARALNRPAFLTVPAFALRMLYGEMAGLLLASQRVVPVAAEAAGFRFRHPHLAEALAESVKS